MYSYKENTMMLYSQQNKAERFVAVPVLQCDDFNFALLLFLMRLQ